jgi:hypothetical protein
MASYLDNIPTFNEYVEQRPQDEMLKVGLFKQKAYNEGVQKIQNSIDNIIGLDIIQPEQRKYLESKLNSLGGQLNSVAASDFSNFQLVNSVDGMTKQLVNDPIILNAVASTGSYRKQKENQDKINTDGKGSASNDAYFNQQVEDWMGGGLDAQFTGQYTPYVDFNKEAREIIKGLVKTKDVQEIAFEQDANGKWRIMDAITRVEVEGVSADRIQTALQAGLTPEAKRQMSIDGLYQYTGVSPEQFSQDLNTRYTDTFDGLLEQRDSLQGLKKLARSSEEKDNIQLQIDAIDNQTKYLQSEYDSISEGFANGDVEAAKANLYATDWMKNFSNAYSYRNVSETYKTNPWFEADFKKKQEIQRQEEWLANYNQREAHHREDYDLKVKEMQFNGVWGVPVGVTDFTEQDDDGVAALFKSDLEGKKKELSAFEEMMKTKYGINDGTLSEADAADKTNRLFSQPDFQADLSQYNLMKRGVDAAELLDYTLAVEADLQFPTQNLENGLPNPHFLLQYANDSANRKAYIPSDGVNSETATGYIYPTQSIDVGEGIVGTMMPNTDYSQLASAFSYFDNNYKVQEGGGYVQDPSLPYANWVPGDMVPVGDAGTYPADLAPEMRGMYDIWRAGNLDDANAFQTTDDFTRLVGNHQLGDKYENLYGEVKQYQRNMNRRSQINADLRAQYIADGIKKNNIMSQSMRYEVPLVNTAQKQQLRSKLLALKQEAEGGGVVLNNPEDFESLIAGLNAANVVTDGEDDFRLTVTGGGTGADATQYTEEIKLTKPQFDMLFPSGQYYQSPAIQTFNQEYLPQMLKSRSPLKESYPNGLNSFPTYYKDPQSFWTTATDSSYETKAGNAGIPQSHFMEVLYYGVEGNLVSEENPKETNRFRLFLNITDPTTGILHENIMMVPPSGGSGIIDKSKVAFTISQLTDQFIYRLLNPTKAYNSSAQNTLIQAAKTPKK